MPSIPTRPRAPANTGGQRRERVLVEDPDPAWRDLMAQMLDPEGYEVDTCPGPGGLTEGCPLLAHQPCPKAERADIILNSLPVDNFANAAVLRSQQEIYRDKLSVLEGEPPAWSTASEAQRARCDRHFVPAVSPLAPEPHGPEGWVPLRPDGVRTCPDGDHPVVLLKEPGGSRELALRIDECEARRLRDEFHGMHRPPLRTYETIETLIAELGGTVAALRLVGDRHRGLSGVLDVATDGVQVRVPAHSGDVVALAWRLDLPVLAPTEATGVGDEECAEWRPRHSFGVTAANGALRHVVPPPDPEDYDW
jgi:bifunctional DNase/RNase/CheY-like chemotaxis protein